jgi:hypothetical protein
LLAILESIEDFFAERVWLYYLVFFVCLAIFLLAFFSPEPKVQQPSTGELYSFNYGPVKVFKTVFAEGTRHLEKIVVSSQRGARMLSLFVLVPKALAKSTADISAVSNGRINVIKADPLYKIDALNSDSIALELLAPSTGQNLCSLLVVVHSAAVAEMSQEQLQSIVDAIIAKDVPELDCAKANEIEKDLSERVYKAATQE